MLWGPVQGCGGTVQCCEGPVQRCGGSVQCCGVLYKVVGVLYNVVRVLYNCVSRSSLRICMSCKASVHFIFFVFSLSINFAWILHE